MHELKHEEPIEDKIKRLEDYANLLLARNISDAEYVKTLAEGKDNLTNQLKKSEENGHVAGVIILFLTLCLVAGAIWCGQLQKNNRLWQTGSETIQRKTLLVIRKDSLQQEFVRDLTYFRMGLNRQHTDSLQQNRVHKFELEMPERK